MADRQFVTAPQIHRIRSYRIVLQQTTLETNEQSNKQTNKTTHANNNNISPPSQTGRGNNQCRNKT